MTFRILFLFIEGLLLISPLIYLYSRGGKIDVFHPLILFSGAFSLFYFFPQIYYVFHDIGLFKTNQNIAIQTLVYSNLAIVSFYFGYLLLDQFLRDKKKKWQQFEISRKQVIGVVALLTCISLIAYVTFIGKVGGIIYYFNNLNNTIPLTAGKIYYVWGILLFKTGFLFHYIFRLQNKDVNQKTFTLSNILLAIHFILTLLIIITVGSRIIVLGFIVEVLVLFHYMYKRITFKALLLYAFISLFLFVLGMGAWRNYGWQKQRDRYSFQEFLSVELSDNLFNRLFNNYFDSVRNFGYVLKYTNHGIPVQWGRTYFALVVQPLPRSIRPSVELPLEKNFDQTIRCPKGNYCGIDPLLGELYKNFLFVGIPVGLAFLGLLYQLLYSKLINQNPGGITYGVYAMFSYGIFYLLRGAFVGHMSLLLMDLVPFIIIALLIKNIRLTT